MAAMSDDTRTTLILVGVLGFFAIFLMGVRLVLRKRRGQPFNLSEYVSAYHDYLVGDYAEHIGNTSYFTMVAIFCLVGRSVFTTIVLLWENNNISASLRASHVFTDDEIYRRTVGSKLTLVNRAVYNT